MTLSSYPFYKLSLSKEEMQNTRQTVTFYTRHPPGAPPAPLTGSSPRV